MKKRKLLIKILSVAFVICTFLGLVACQKEQPSHVEEPKAQYEQINGYTLVLNEYYIPNADKVVKIIDPMGSEVNFSKNPFIPTAVGEYQIVYENKTEKLTVLVKSESITFETTENLASEYVAGNTLRIPSVTIKDDFKSYTVYSITVKNNGQIVLEQGNLNANVEVFVELINSGKYEIEYSCIDGFGQLKSKIVEFNVVDEPVIIYSELADCFSYGDSVDFGTPYGFYKGEKYSVEISLITPSEQEKTLSNGTYEFTEAGEYEVVYSCEIDGKQLSVNKNFSVNYTAKNIANASNGDIVVNTSLPEYSKVKGDAVLVKGLSNFTFNYEPIINLNQFDKNDNLISFVPYSDNNTSFSEMVLTLTDIYDENNSLTFYWYAKEHWGIGHSYLALKRPNGDYGLSNETSSGAMEVYGKIRPEGAVIYEGSFFGKQNGSSAIFNLQYDITENKAYCVVQGNQWLLIDADDEPEIAFEDRFYGFTTGEVYLSVKTLNNSNAGIYITEIAGKSFGAKALNPNDYQDQFAFLSKTEEQLPVGEVNLAYPIPQISVSDNCVEKIDFKAEVFYQGVKQNFESNGKFIPKQSGTYSVIYQGIYNGFSIEKTVNFEIVNELAEITVDFPQQETVVSGDTYKVPDFVVSGISDYETLVTIKDTNQTFEKNMFGEFVLNTNENVIVEIVVKDKQLPDRIKTFEYEIPLINKTVLELSGEMPKNVRAGSRVILPDFTVYNNSTTQSLDKQIIINKGQASETVLTDTFVYEVPKNLSNITVTFVGGFGTEYQSDLTRYTYNVKVISENADISELLDIDSQSTAKLIDGENGLSITTKKSGKLFEMPYSLPTTELLVRFALRASKINYSAIKIVLTDSNRQDKQVVLTISDTSNEKANLKVNNDSTIYQLKYSTNGDLYDFSLIINQKEKSVLNFSGKTVAKINYFTDGTVFNGFSNKLAYLSVELENVNAFRTSEFIVNEIGNQQFGYYMSAFGKKDNDNNGPIIFSDLTANTMEAEYGSTLILPEFFAKDVLQTSSSLTLTVVDPATVTILKNVSASSVDSIKLDKYGKYNLVYTAKDSLGNKTEKRITITVKDRILPTIEVVGSYKTEYELGSSITVSNAIASDNNYTDVSVTVLLVNSTGVITKVEFGEKIELNREGSYKLIYRAEDGDYNVKTVEYEFEVKA